MTAARVALFVALAFVLLALAGPAATVERADASDGETAAGAQVELQVDGDGGDDTRVAVQLWTVLAAGGAAAVALVLFLLRVMLGRVKEAPPPSEHDGH